MVYTYLTTSMSLISSLVCTGVRPMLVGSLDTTTLFTANGIPLVVVYEGARVLQRQSVKVLKNTKSASFTLRQQQYGLL